ncbi:unnamed protein product [Mucor hiemalis]
MMDKKLRFFNYFFVMRSRIVRKTGIKSTISSPIKKPIKVKQVKLESSSNSVEVKVEDVTLKKVKTKKDILINFTTSSENFDILEETHLNNAMEHMKKYDPKLANYLTDDTVEAFKERMNRGDGSNPFMSLTKSIIFQQIHGKAAASILARFVELFDIPSEVDEKWFPTPEEVLKKSIEDLRSAGLSGRKVDYIQNLATHFVEKSITPDKFDVMSDEEISTQLCAVKGIGQWTVDMFLMLDLHHPDVLPLGDLVVRKGVAKHFGLALPSDKKKIFPLPQHMVELTEAWRPYRSLGSWLMWRTAGTTVVGDS